MKYIFFSLLLFGLFGTTAQAQNIPDANFANAIRSQCPTCIDANNNLLPPAQTLQTLQVRNSNINNVQGLQGFSALRNFDCDSNQLTNIPILPTNLRTIYCSNNQLTNLPSLPPNLDILDCERNQLASLPTLPATLRGLVISNNLFTSLPNLSTSLENLGCSNNQLTSLPALPNALEYLHCEANQLTNLPALPAGLKTLGCGQNQLTTLPTLPATLLNLYTAYNSLISLPTLPVNLKFLYCEFNQLSTLPNIPVDLEDLNCNNNNLTSLPNIPGTRLQWIKCQSNQLVSLPNLPNGLLELNCENNQLTNLPALPSSLNQLNCQHNALTSLPTLPTLNFQYLDCSYNALTSLPVLPNSLYNLLCSNNPNLSCLPLLPDSLTYLNCDTTNIQCLPNDPRMLIFTSSNLPLCFPNNPNGCAVYSQIVGTVFQDYNNNCVYNPSTDSLIKSTLVKATDAQNNHFYALTNAFGQYSFSVPNGVYTISSLASPASFYNFCTTTSVSVNNPNVFQIRDLGLKPLIACGLLKTEINANLLRRCMLGEYDVFYQNIGTALVQNAYVDIEFDSYLSYVSNTANISVTNLGNNKYRFPLGNLNISQLGNFKAVVSVSCTSTLGQVHCTEATIAPNSPCGVNWNGAVIQILDTCMRDSVVFRLVNSGSNMLASQTYSIVEDNLMYRPATAFQLNAGGTLDIAIPTQPNHTYRIEVQQAPNYPALLGDSLAWAIIQNCNGISNTTASSPTLFYTQNAALAVSNDCTPNRGSYDPNQKTAQQIGYGSQHFINANTPLEYKIEFQNTGTDTAFRVVILDTLDTNVLDPTSIQIGTSSHNFTWALLQNNILKFTFDNIMLVDSFANEPLSHGYVTFHIAQKPNLAVNTVINNKAAIYFDYNAPIITNTCFHTIGTNFIPRVAVSVGEVLNSNVSVKAYPNPFQTATTLEVVGADNQVITLKIVDAMGKTVQTQESQQSTLQISRENLPTGLYFYQLFGNGQLLNTGKLIAE